MDNIKDNIRQPTLKLLISRTDYVFARGMGFTGAQLPDSAGVDVGL